MKNENSEPVDEPHEDGRESVRRRAYIPCVVTSGLLMVPEHILDLSSGGAFVQCREDIPPGSGITSTFELRDQNETVEYNIKAVVAHAGRFIQGFQNFKGFGVQFKKLPAETRLKLREAFSEAEVESERKYVLY